MKQKSKKARLITIAIIFIILAVLPFFLSMFRLSLLARFMCYAIVALGLDMIWGYSGILSLGHGVYFGLGGYCMAMYLKLASSGGQLPDFMTWSGATELPWFWRPFTNPAFAMGMVVLLPALLAIVIGSLTFLNRIRGVYFSILSQALAMIMATLLIGSQALTGGSNGLTNFSTFMGMDLNAGTTKITLFYVTLGALVLIFALCYFLTNRSVGKIFIAIRDSENRLRFNGYNTSTYKVFVYALSAVIAGIAGALYVMQVGIISPTEVGVSSSIEMIIWVAIGGKGTLIGPIIGAILVNSFKTVASENFPELWSYFIGILFVVAILFLPKGIVSIKDIPQAIRNFFTRRREEKKYEKSDSLEKKGNSVKY